MMEGASFFSGMGRTPRVLDAGIPLSRYVPLDLSVDNRELAVVNITDPAACEAYVAQVLQENNGTVAYGGYLERRNLYRDKTQFGDGAGPARNIHLGVDFWCTAGTLVLAPLDGAVHSFQNNGGKGDYGPTLILEHRYAGTSFFTLYGHLATASLEGLFVGKPFRAGEPLGALGTAKENGNYAPHLHFQLIWDMGDLRGDYPGVASQADLHFHRKNCPDPNLLLKL
ncbi:peptidoglycan DD-metalloendopeptidase family protein [Maribacter sp. 2307ULW6-5]|uniref:peptidoglycan DD-metalloendopeptidase family protein n=1 Tax=Maribacter sp. 2307ULW6-5 TaxID=3386275 RepID=UPI0039BC2E43